MRTLVAEHTFTEEIKKSRFVVYAAPVSSPQAALDFFKKVSDNEATHNCWAYKIGQLYRFNDDGEPGGTAGRPILQAIEGQDLDNTAVLVIRYYGGIKLGTGGLVRAYGGSAAKCLNQAPWQEIIPTKTVLCSCDFSLHSLLKSRFVAYDIMLENESFHATGVDMTLAVPLSVLNEVADLVINLSKARASWEVLE